MTNDHAITGWAVTLEGHKFDLSDWATALKPPFEPSVEQLAQGETVLRSHDFDGLDDATDVLERARELIGRLNGAMRLYNRCHPVSAGPVMRFDEQGHRQIYMVIESNIVARAHVSAVGMAVGADGEPIETVPEPSATQRVMGLASGDDVVADLLRYLGQADNWYDIYKAIECAQDLVVGGEAGLKTFLDESGPSLKRVKTTANFYRHALAERPSKPATLDEARAAIAGMADRVVQLIAERH